MAVVAEYYAEHHWAFLRIAQNGTARDSIPIDIDHGSFVVFQAEPYGAAGSICTELHQRMPPQYLLYPRGSFIALVLAAP